MEDESRNVKSRPAENAGRLFKTRGMWGISDATRQCDCKVGENRDANGDQDVDDGQDHAFSGFGWGL